MHDAVEESGDWLGYRAELAMSKLGGPAEDRSDQGGPAEDRSSFMDFETLSRGLAALRAAEAAVAGDPELVLRVQCAQLPVLYTFIMCWMPLAAQARAAAAEWPLPESIEDVVAHFLEVARKKNVTKLGGGGADGFVRLQRAVYEVRVDPGSLPDALRIKPTRGGFLEFYDAEIGTKMNMVFERLMNPKKIKRAWLELLVDDIDDSREATIILNGGTRIRSQGGVLGEGAGHRGRLIVPVDALVEGANTFEFEFSDNLNGQTRGYTINESLLLLELK